MSDMQVLFRVDSVLLQELDSSIASSGFTTRNEWFRNAVRNFLEEIERKNLLKKLEKMKLEGMTEADIVKMVQAWREEDN